MFATVGEIERILNDIAPFDSAEGFDNVGLLVGRRDAPVSAILVTLDATWEAVQEAKRLGAQLIVSHHPLLFHARKNLTEEDIEGRILCEMVRGNLSLISAHTNLDKTAFSGSACCARLLRLTNLRQEGYLFLGELPTPLSAGLLTAQVTQALHWPARLYGRENLPITTLAIAGGAYCEGWEEAKGLGAQALLTGEVRHHNALAAAMNDFALLDGGHGATEATFTPDLVKYLQNRMDDVQYKVRVYPSKSAPFGCV